MRVTTTSTYRNYTNSVNSVHSKLNKSMAKIYSGKAYQSAAESPLSYYEGNRLDTQHQDIETKLDLISDVKNRMYQQEQGSLSIQNTLSQAKSKVLSSINVTNTDSTTVSTYRDDLQQKLLTMVTDLNAQYQDMYVYGGNDLTTTPFEFDTSSMTLTYNHTFPENPKEVISLHFALQYDETNGYSYALSATDSTGTQLSTDEANTYLIKSMSEQGLMDIGYGDINDQSSLIDTYTGGINMLTGMSSDYIRARANNPDISDADLVNEILGEFATSAVGLVSQSVDTMNGYIREASIMGEDAANLYYSSLSGILGKMDDGEAKLSTVYTTLGNRYSLMEATATKLEALSDSLEEIYSDKLGADPYEAITEMYSYQYSYSASLQLASSLMSMSLFDFIS